MTAALTKPYRLFTDADMSATITSSAVDVSRLIYGSVSLWWTGTPNGTITAEAQNGDAPWIALTGFSQSGGLNSGSALFLFTILPYEKIRIKYTLLSASPGVLNAVFVAKGY
jgi:hypothetical protein